MPTKKTIIILGSAQDEPFSRKITDKLDQYNIFYDVHIASAHKTPQKVLEILEKNKNQKHLIYITVAGRSNALSGLVAANCNVPVIACPPFQDKLDMLVNIQSSLQMPSAVPVLTILDPENAALAIKRIFDIIE